MIEKNVYNSVKQACKSVINHNVNGLVIFDPNKPSLNTLVSGMVFFDPNKPGIKHTSQ